MIKQGTPCCFSTRDALFFVLFVIRAVRDEVGVRLVCDALVFDYRSVKLTAVIHGSLLGFVIHSHKSEARRLTLTPFEIIKEAPVIISLDRIFRLGYKLQLIVYKQRTESVGIVAGSVLSNVDGRVILSIKTSCKLDESLVIYLPTKIIFISSLAHSI